MTQWFQTSVKYTKEFKDGTLKRVTEPYLVSAVNHGDAEARIHTEVGEFIRGEFIVTGVKPVKFQDIFQYDDTELFMEAKVSYILEDADTGRETKTVNNFLVSAVNVKQAYERIEESLKGLMVSFSIPQIRESSIVEIFPYQSMEDK